MTRLYAKLYDEKIIQIDLINLRDVADGRIVFSVDDYIQDITYYFCQKCSAKDGDATEWRFYPIKFLVGPPTTTEQYFIYDLDTEKLKQSSSSPASQKQRPQVSAYHHASFLTDAEKNKLLAFHPIISRVKSMRSDRLKISENDAQQQTVDTLVVQHYHRYTLDLLTQCVQTLNSDKIKKTLEEHWKRIKNNLLCYTTLSNDPRYHELMTLFCDIAVVLADRINQTKKEGEQKVCAIELLMPGLTLESQYPNSFPDLNDSRLNASTETLMRVLQTHIIGNQGQCLVPVNLLSNPDNPFITETEKKQALDAYPSDGIQSTNLQELRNPYFDDDDAKIAQTGFLDDDTLSRLQRFSPFHETLFQVQAEYQSLLNTDQSTLLAQLHRLIKALHQFSAHKGIGKNDAMAEGGEKAIGLFFDYYNQLTKFNDETTPKRDKTILDHIPVEIQRHLQNLEMRNRIYCTGLFAESLDLLVNQKNNTSLLEKISIDQGQQAKLLEEKRQSFENNQHIIKDRSAVFSSAQHPAQSPPGKDCLGLTNDMLNLLQMKDHYHIRSMQDLYNLMQSAPEEIALLSQLPEKSKEIMMALRDKDGRSGLENLVTLITHYPDQQIIAFFKANCDAIFDIGKCIITTTRHFTALFDIMRDSTRDALLDLIVSQARNLIKTSDLLIMTLVYDKFTEVQRAQIWNAVSGKLGEIIQYRYQLLALLDCSKLNELQRTQIWNAVSGNLGRMIQNGDQLLDLITCDKLNEAQRTQILNAVKDKPGVMMLTSFELERVLNYDKLTEDQYKQILIHSSVYCIQHIILRWSKPNVSKNCEKICNIASKLSDKNDIDSIKNDLGNLIAKYAAKTILESNYINSCCGFFHRDQTPELTIKFLAAKEMLREISGGQQKSLFPPEDLSEERKKQIAKARQNGNLKQIQEKITFLFPQLSPEVQKGYFTPALSMPLQ